MSSPLDPSILAAIIQEARQCFLDEDAPEYLQSLEEGLKSRYDSPDFISLLRAAHSLKGGAGLASLSSLQELSHKLEDVLQALQQGQIEQTDLGWELVEKSINEVAFLLSQARTSQDILADSELLAALDNITISTTSAHAGVEKDFNQHDFIQTALTKDLEESLVVVEDLSTDTPENLIKDCLENFYNECLLLGESLDLPWLTEAIEPLSQIYAESSATESLLFTQGVITLLRKQRDDYLAEQFTHSDGADSHEDANYIDRGLVTSTLTQDLEESFAVVEELDGDTPATLILQCLESFSDECLFLGESLNLPWLTEAIAPLTTTLADSSPESALSIVQDLINQLREKRDRYLQNPHATSTEVNKPIDDVLVSSPIQTKVQNQQPPKSFSSEQASLSHLKIPLQRLESMTNNVEELILIQAQMQLQQKQLEQANKRLRQLNKQFEPIREQIQTIYNQLAIESTTISRNSSRISTNNQNLKSSESLSTDTDSSELAFDTLELDRYTELHSSLQYFQELMLQVQETRTDIDLVNRELAEDLEQVDKNLSALYNNVTESRLVPFSFLAKRFIPQIHHLNQRYGKSVNLEIEGEDTLIDQVLLEQLQTPLTHLLNNAFDHGIESSSERIANHKPEVAQILFKAQINNNQLEINVVDDGRGINLEKVYQRALARGICSADSSIEQFRPEEIIDWIFQPDFSTAEQVTDISGRGMGMDIVRSKIRKLRGTVHVTTNLGQGTTFTLKLPLNLSLLSLLLVQLHNRIIAIPSSSIRETLLESELDWLDRESSTINWHQQAIPLMPLANLLPCPRQPIRITQSRTIIVLESSWGYFAVSVDTLLSETQLIVKPFDETIPVPPYLAGCTILGTGEVVPVILPQAFKISSAQTQVTVPQPSIDTTPTILIAEDSVATRRLLERLLTAVGYQLVVCRDGKEALEQLNQRQEGVNLVISDVEMPKVNGFELLKKLRANSSWKDIPVIMATSRTGDRHRQQAMQLGANSYLGKPIQAQELLDTVASLIKK